MAIDVEGLNPDYFISAVENIQPQYGDFSCGLSSPDMSFSRLWSQILINFVVPQAPKFPHRERKLAAVGVTRTLCHSTLMMQQPSIQAWYVFTSLSEERCLISTHRSPTYSALGKIFGEPQYFTKSTEIEADVAITAIDFEEQAAGYQAAYSRLAASEMPQSDPVGYIPNPLQYFQQELEKLRGRVGQQVDALIAAAGT